MNDNKAWPLTVYRDSKPYSFVPKIVGDLALDFDTEGWNIYHIPTQTCFDNAVPPSEHSAHCDTVHDEVDWRNNGKCNCEPLYEYTEQQLLTWMAKVQEKNKVSWLMLKGLTYATYKDKGAQAKRIIQDWCLSVPVNDGE